MANMYRSVLASGGGVQPTGDAVAADVLTGKTFSNAQATGIAGTMPNRGAVSQSIEAGNSYTIPAGYHNGNGVITATGLNIPVNTGFRVPQSTSATSIDSISIVNGSATFAIGVSIVNKGSYSQVEFNMDKVGMYGTNDLVSFTAIAPGSPRTYNISAYKYIVFDNETANNVATFT